MLQRELEWFKAEKVRVLVDNEKLRAETTRLTVTQQAAEGKYEHDFQDIRKELGGRIAAVRKEYTDYVRQAGQEIIALKSENLLASESSDKAVTDQARAVSKGMVAQRKEFDEAMNKLLAGAQVDKQKAADAIELGKIGKLK